MKKIHIILGSIAVFIVAASFVGVFLYTSYTNPSNPTPLFPARTSRVASGIPDILNNDNINVMLTRPDNWKKIVDEPIISEEDMEIIDGSTATIPITAELYRQFFDYSDSQMQDSTNAANVNHGTTHIAYTNLIYYTRDEYDEKMYEELGEWIPGVTVKLFYNKSLILVTPPSDEEKQMAKDEGLELDLTPVAKDGFVFITHKNNPVDSLTVEQVQDIYTGKITNWKQVGGNNAEIRPFQREANSGSQTAMEQIVMQGKKMIDPITTDKIILYGMGDLVSAVAQEYDNEPSSIGYTYYYYINNLYKNENIKVLKINGKAPSNKNLIDETYPFSTNYYAVIRANEEKNSPARKLRDFLISPKGQEVIEMAGYCRNK